MRQPFGVSVTTQVEEEGTRESLTSALLCTRVLVVDDVVSSSVSCGEGCAPLCCCLRATFSSFRTVVLAVGFVGLCCGVCSWVPFWSFLENFQALGFWVVVSTFECCGWVVLESISGGERHVACLCGKLGPQSNREGA